MKPLAIFLVLLVIAALAGVGWLWYSSNMTAVCTDCVATDPVTQEAAFRDLKSSVESGSFMGTLFSKAPLTNPEDYLFYTWTVHMDNKTFLPATVMEVQITPMSGDILVIGDPAEHTLDARSETDLTVTMLTSREKHSVREAIVTWYVWGLPFSSRITLGK